MNRRTGSKLSVKGRVKLSEKISFEVKKAPDLKNSQIGSEKLGSVNFPLKNTKYRRG